MKKEKAILLVILFSLCLLWTQIANAALLGLSAVNPDLHSDNEGLVKYTRNYGGQGVNLLELNPDGFTLQFKLNDATPSYQVIPYGSITTLAIFVDDNGNLLPGVPDTQPFYNGVRYNDFKQGVIDLDGDYTPDPGEPGYDTGVLLAANIIAFGWETYNPGLSRFEFLFDFELGEIEEIAPEFSQYPIGAIITTDGYCPLGTANTLYNQGFDGGDWQIGKVKMDQFPTPEPCTLITLGIGLLGLLGLGIKKRS